MAYKGENVKIRRKQGGDALEFASGAEAQSPFHQYDAER